MHIKLRNRLIWNKTDQWQQYKKKLENCRIKWMILKVQSVQLPRIHRTKINPKNINSQNTEREWEREREIFFSSFDFKDKQMWKYFCFWSDSSSVLVLFILFFFSLSNSISHICDSRVKILFMQLVLALVYIGQ